MAQLEIIIIVEGWQKQQVNVKLHLLRTILHDKCSLRDCFQLLLLLQMPQLLLKNPVRTSGTFNWQNLSHNNLCAVLMPINHWDERLISKTVFWLDIAVSDPKVVCLNPLPRGKWEKTNNFYYLKSLILGSAIFYLFVFSKVKSKYVS